MATSHSSKSKLWIKRSQSLWFCSLTCDLTAPSIELQHPTSATRSTLCPRKCVAAPCPTCTIRLVFVFLLSFCPFSPLPSRPVFFVPRHQSSVAPSGLAASVRQVCNTQEAIDAIAVPQLSYLPPKPLPPRPLHAQRPHWCTVPCRSCTSHIKQGSAIRLRSPLTPHDKAQSLSVDSSTLQSPEIPHPHTLFPGIFNRQPQPITIR